VASSASTRLTPQPVVASSASTLLTPPLLTPPLSSKLLRIPYAAGIILVAPDDGRIRPKHVELSLLLK
jgi:hypothetical protein